MTLSVLEHAAPRPAASTETLRVAAVVSLLHELADRNSATRLFRGAPVLAHTLRRLSRATMLRATAVLCWDDQRAAVDVASGASGAIIVPVGSRVALPSLDAVAAARRWADGWRGGLLGTCDFDLGFYAPWAREAAAILDADAIVPVDAASALIDPALIDGVIAHAAAHPDAEFCFAPAGPGLCGPVLRRPLLERLAAARTHLGRLLHYHPDVVSREPLSGESCAPVPLRVARTVHRFTIGSDRQARRLARVAGDDGCDVPTGAEELVGRLSDDATPDALPRDVVLELNTRRATRPIYWPGRHLEISRPELSLDTARRLFDELATLDDTRLTIAGVGDPLLADNLFEVIAAARQANLVVHVESDFAGVDTGALQQLATVDVDVVSVHVPATTPETYAAVMGVDGYRAVLENLQRFVTERAARGRGVPLLAPTFTKCRDNLAEMEAWYDQWLRAVASAVITGPSDHAGQIPDAGVAGMEPPRRRPCARLASRLTVLSDGRIVSCEQDVLGRQALGVIGTNSVRDIWRERFGALRADHRNGRWGERPLCASCREWHRP